MRAAEGLQSSVPSGQTSGQAGNSANSSRVEVSQGDPVKQSSRRDQFRLWLSGRLARVCPVASPLAIHLHLSRLLSCLGRRSRPRSSSPPEHVGVTRPSHTAIGIGPRAHKQPGIRPLEIRSGKTASKHRLGRVGSILARQVRLDLRQVEQWRLSWRRSNQMDSIAMKSQ